MTQRAAYIEKMETQLDELNKKMGGLATTAKEAKEDAQKKYRDEMDKLREQSKVAVAKLEELKTASTDSWDTLVGDMEKMHDAFTHSFFSFFQTPGADTATAKDEEKDSSKDDKKKEVKGHK